MKQVLQNAPLRDRVSEAKRRSSTRQTIGLLLWVATVLVIYGTLPLVFELHLFLVFVWTVGSGLAFLMLSRADHREVQAVYDESLSQINVAHSDLVTQMATYSEAKDAFTGEHIQRVRKMAYQLAVGLGKNEEEAAAIGNAAIAHDLGKIGIPDDILGKPAKLTKDEFDLMKKHTIIGEKALGDSPLFELERKTARHHHEWWNGEGYPDAISGREIPLVARITAVADVFDALVTKRPYKDPWPLDRAVDYLRERSGTQFDPDVVEVFLDQYTRGRISLPANVSTESEPEVADTEPVGAIATSV